MGGARYQTKLSGKDFIMERGASNDEKNMGTLTKDSKDQKSIEMLSKDKKIKQGEKGKAKLLDKIPYKNKKFWFFVGGTILLIIALIAIFCVDRNDYKVVDLTNMRVSEACAIVKSHGWEVQEPISGVEYPNTKIDCDNNKRAVGRYDYDKGEHLVTLKWKYHQLTQEEYDGKTISEVCALIKSYDLSFEFITGRLGSEYDVLKSCEGDEVPDKIVQYERRVYLGILRDKEANTNETEEEPVELQSLGEETSVSQSNSNNSEWRQMLEDYETWVDKYVNFMRKYKNASASDMTGMINDYSSLVSEMTEWSEKIKNVQGTLSGNDLTEYVNMLSRITQKLSSI